MHGLISNCTEFVISNEKTLRYERAWLTYSGDGQAVLAKAHKFIMSERDITQRECQLFCRCRTDVQIRMTVVERKKAGTVGKYSLRTISGHSSLHDNRCENHFANDKESGTSDAHPDRPVRPKIYGHERSVNLHSRGATTSGSDGPKGISTHEGRGLGYRLSYESTPAKWGRQILSAAFYNTTLKRISNPLTQLRKESLLAEIIDKRNTWAFREGEPLSKRMYIPFVKEDRGDHTADLIRKLHGMQDNGPGTEELFLLGEFSRTVKTDGHGIQISFSVRNVDPKEFPYVILPVDKSTYIEAAGKVLNRGDHVWHYVAATVGFVASIPTITNISFIPFLRSNGGIIATQTDYQLAALMAGKQIPYDRPIPHLAAYKKAWGDKLPDFVILDEQGNEQAIIVVYGRNYKYQKIEADMWNAYYEERCREWELRYLPWHTYMDRDIPGTITEYLELLSGERAVKG